MIATAQTVGNVKVVTGRLRDTNQVALREMGDLIRSQLAPSVTALGSVLEGRPLFVVMATADAGVNARDIAAKVAPTLGGSGGGRPDVAQAGGRDPEKLSEALAQVVGLVEAQLASK